MGKRRRPQRIQAHRLRKRISLRNTPRFKRTAILPPLLGDLEDAHARTVGQIESERMNKQHGDGAVITEQTVAKLRISTWWQITIPIIGVAVWITAMLHTAKTELMTLSMENRRDHERLMTLIANIEGSQFVRGPEIEDCIVALRVIYTNTANEAMLREMWRDIRKRHATK